MGAQDASQGVLDLFCKQDTMMKYLLVVGLLQRASASTTGAPSPSMPPAGGAVVTISGNFVASFGSCPPAKTCATNAQCTAQAMKTLQTQSNLPSLPTGTGSAPGCPRRLSQYEMPESVNGMVVTASRQLQAVAGDVKFDYTFTATANQQDALIQAIQSMGGSNKNAFLGAFKSALNANGLSSITSSLTIKSFSTPSIPTSQVSAAVGSQAALPAFALLVGLVW